ncbi:SRPBCC family protein [Streptomyces sp. NRRL S-813]|uniref:SRPBCC family protein n=1 Tax=Streptomyces sp. NRRL S-813 TaxID=1463919 RepID=UPI000ACE5B71|nr:SRPBCC family protein [Streptomyces sp. NRRL S-813]
MAALGGYAVWTHTHPVRLTASIEIEADPEQVWAVLTDFGAYPRWNPFLAEAAVTSDDGLRPGATMRNRLEHKGGAGTFTPTVLKASAGRELRRLGSATASTASSSSAPGATPSASRRARSSPAWRCPSPPTASGWTPCPGSGR